MSAADLDRLGEMPGHRPQFLRRVVQFYLDFHRKYDALDGIFVHDSTTVTYMLAPHLFTWRELPVRVDTGTGVARGRTVPAFGRTEAEGPWKGRRPVRILTGVDVRAAVELELEHHAR